MPYALLRVPPTKYGGHGAISKHFDLWLTLVDPSMTFDLSNALHFGQ